MRHVLKADSQPSVKGFWDWYLHTEDPNYDYIVQMTLTFLHALMVLRDGVRKGNSDAIAAGQNRVMPIFFARNHPRYQAIVARDIYQKVLMPEEVKAKMNASITLSRTGRKGHYQGGDAILEEINKEAKSWIPPGVPTETQWIRVFRTMDDIRQVGTIIF